MGKTYKDAREHRHSESYVLRYTKKKTPMGKCITGKVGFPNEAMAQQRAGEILSSGKSKAEFFRVYLCQFCKHYHLTSK